MNKLFTAYRYSAFVLLIISNVVLCSVAAWNLTVALAVQFTMSIQVDVLSIAVGAAGLLFIFPILFVDVSRKESVTRQVWFECLWVGILSLLELAAAAAVTTTLSGMDCVVSDKNGMIQVGPCISTELMLAFAWTGAADLIFYLGILTLTAILHQRDDPLIWQSNVLDYDWYATERASLNSAPSSPAKLRRSMFIKSARRSKRFDSKRHNLDLEKQEPQSSTTPPSATLPMQTAPVLTPAPVASMRPSFDQPRPSFDRSPAPFTPRQFKLSAVPASPVAASTAVPRAPLSTRPSLDRPPVAFTPRKLQLASALPASATVTSSSMMAQIDNAVPATAFPQPPMNNKKRVLRLHRPPSLDLSQITNQQ